MSMPSDHLYRTDLSIHVGYGHEHTLDDVGALIAAFMERHGHFWTLIPRMHTSQESHHQVDLYLMRAVSCYEEHPDHLEELVKQEHYKLAEFVRGFLAATRRRKKSA